MLFNSIVFIFVFLPITLAIYFSIGKLGHHRVAIAWLVATSLFFYGWWNPAYIGLILASMLFNYSMGVALSTRELVGKKRLLLTVGVTVNLALLGYYKYANFFVYELSPVFGNGYRLETIVLPLAISFFTFQQVAYLVDAYDGQTREYSFLHYCLFVIFFPQLIAGPIVHHKQILPQFADDRVYRIDYGNLSAGLAIFLLGLFKKVVFADGAALYANPIFNAAENGVTLSFFEAWVGVLAYTFQLYFDFSGYSDMAIGLGRMFNITLPLNFASPYKAHNIIDFWKRWHMTLSTFLRDYLYIPLGGNRKGAARRYANLLITMLLGGLWHGAGWTFVLWGGLHGVYLIVNHAWHGFRRTVGFDGVSIPFIGKSVAWLLTFIAVMAAWVPFRAASFDGAISIYEGMIGLNGFVLPQQFLALVPFLAHFVEGAEVMGLLGGGKLSVITEMLLFLAAMFVVILMPNLYEMKHKHRLILVAITFYFTIQSVLFARVASEFLYFQF